PSGSSTTVPGAVLDSSTPAAASTRPCRVCAIVVGPRLATTRTVSASMACSRGTVTTRPSALLTILEVTTRMSPSRRSGTASAMSAARSAPAVTSGSPVTGMTVTGPVLTSGLTSVLTSGLTSALPQLEGQVERGAGDRRGGGQVAHQQRQHAHLDPGQGPVISSRLVLVVDQPAADQLRPVVRGDRRGRGVH